MFDNCTFEGPSRVPHGGSSNSCRTMCQGHVFRLKVCPYMKWMQQWNLDFQKACQVVLSSLHLLAQSSPGTTIQSCLAKSKACQSLRWLQLPRISIDPLHWRQYLGTFWSTRQKSKIWKQAKTVSGLETSNHGYRFGHIDNFLLSIASDLSQSGAGYKAGAVKLVE